MLSLPCFHSTLDASDAWRLARASRKVQISWDAVRFYTKCKLPKALGAAVCSGAWTPRRAKYVLECCRDTPYRNTRNVVLQLLRHVLTPNQLWSVGYSTNNVLAMRIAQRRFLGSHLGCAAPLVL